MRRIAAILNLHEGEDNREKILENVKKNIEFKGANLWVLACAIIIASVGLNVNSTAVVIGAMLISPLMGPIVGAGFALGVYDFNLLKRSLKNLLNATAVGLIFSTIYFLITPFKDVQSELLARTAPTIYDIIIAFSGGLVGVIAVTRVEKGNPIPGVAIATALMPPLCTAGYGIATFEWSYFLGAFYLYCINCVFIGIATFAIIKYLKYAPKKQVDERQQKRVKMIISMLTFAMLLPASYLAYSLYREQQFKKTVNNFIDNEFTDRGYTVVYQKTSFNTAPKRLELAFLTKRFEKNEISQLQERMDNNEYLKGTRLIIRQDSTDRFNALKGDILKQIKSTENEVSQKDLRIVQLEKQIAANTFDNKKFLKEAKSLFPKIKSFSVSHHDLATGKDSIVGVTAVLYETPTPEDLSDEEKTRLKSWLNERLSVSNVEIFRKK
ncbi:TIGR00341 family protein [Flavobacterium beibuense]|uniref:Membrane protein n=1 Tax=Flavobacterium beibuense TaxID=657326 RepID=A0A444W7C6_9FLAO|nr:TIGR00341 family protein [Flavobacterium beibuense]RYJ41693.1 Membrane protein [Flavobacterium beibuense]